MMKKKLLAVVMSLVTGISMMGCAGKAPSATATPAPTGTPAATSKQDMPTINIGMMPSTDGFPYIIAKEKGIFEKNGVNVELHKFKSAKDRDAALQAGQLDGMMCDIAGAALLKGNGVDVQMTSITQGNFVLLSGKDSGIKTVKDLKDKKVIISKNTVIELVTDTALKSEGLTSKDVKKEEVPPTPLRFQMLMEGKTDATALPDPFATLAKLEGANVLESSNDLGCIFGGMVFKKETIDNKKEALKLFNKSYDEAVDYINGTPLNEYIDLVIKEVGYPEAVKDAVTLPEYKKTTLPSQKDMDLAVNWLKEKGLVPADFDSKTLVAEIK